MPKEYSVVLCGDEDEPTGRDKILQKFAPGKNATDSTEACRQTVDVNGTETLIELVAFDSCATDEAMLRYLIEYADAFVFVFSRFSPHTLETVQRYRDVVQHALQAKGISRDSDEVCFALIGNADTELPVVAGTSSSREELKENLRMKGKLMAQSWGCPYLEVNTAEEETHGVEEAIICIGQAIKSSEKPDLGRGLSTRKSKPPQRFLMRRMLSRFMSG
ncbi:uncharacterized protein BCR38DRAFT_410541 [Pseudomassariella vexata]|uniref:P-loop containing nucleoside triphosphate hydrolase protein n=1 Tax=Pseudomassariella vexata TaxID=1141098 RepID=A0A1Y2DS33_9PEZI|nr:uncharacterized protein BCR38DRAFT_410541 [Pseudomassariella vexata]ORY62092.1 hypothetical protein BCR38DRAFT_410541 [Pseudomassariella vexata]